ncbi:MAG: glycosyltransferase family 8 protein [Clostridia bacterium]|nr:glycosyltransferase family 8 protein [Clostridia bacterium]
MNILFCGDSNVCDGIALSALSICKNTSEAVSFYILTADIENHCSIKMEFADKLEAVIKAKNQNNKVFLIDITESFKSYMPLANMGTRFTPFCMLRLFADTVPQIPDRILYLDTDVLCKSNFSDLYNTDMQNAEIAGVPDRYGKWFFGNILKHNYLNSGVLLLNMKNIRKSGLFKKCRDMCRDKKMFMPDQSALNKLATKRKLPQKYNEQGKIKGNTVFKHFTTFFKFFPIIHTVTVKPWDTEALHTKLHIFEFDDIINEYQRSK